MQMRVITKIVAARVDQTLSAAEVESVLEWAAKLTPRVPFGIKTTEAPHLHRIMAQRAAMASWLRPAALGSRAKDRVRRAGRTVTDGNGFVFVNHTGAICPSGFLPPYECRRSGRRVPGAKEKP